METMVIDTVVKDDLVRIPRKFNNRRVKIIIIDSEEKEDKRNAAPKRLNFRIDETLTDVVPFSDIMDSNTFAKELRENHWR